MRAWIPRSPWAAPGSCYTMEWYRRQRVKAAAIAAFYAALRSGALARPSHCEQCGGTTQQKRRPQSAVMGHHPDYSQQPLLVKWLCAMCHRREHVRFDRGEVMDPYRKCGPVTFDDLMAALRHRVQWLARQDGYIMRDREKRKAA